MGSSSLLQGIFPTQGSNPGLLHCRRILYQLSHRGAHLRSTLLLKVSICLTSPPDSVTLPFLSSCCCCLVGMLCPTLCNPMDCSSPGASVHEISQARILEWVAVSFSYSLFINFKISFLSYMPCLDIPSLPQNYKNKF